MNFPRLPSNPPLWRESLFGLELASLMRDRVFRGHGVPDGGGQPVLLIPGFLAGDGSLGVMTQWLRRNGHRTKRAGMRSNVDCSAAVTERLTQRLEEMNLQHGRRVGIIGQSRGGTFARVLATRRPDLVSGIVTLGTPLLEPLAIHPLVRAQVMAVGALGTARVPGLFRHSCLYGDCCRSFWDDIQAPFPDDIGFMSVYSRRDGVVDWRACLDPAADHVEIGSSHIGMAVNPGAYRAVVEALAEFRAAETGAARATAATAARAA